MQHGRSARRPTPSAARASQRHATPPSCARCATIAMIRRQRRREPVHRHRLQQRQRAAAVIGVLMRDDHRVERADAGGAQERRDDAAAGIGLVVEARAGVVEQRVRVRLHARRRGPARRRAPSCGTCRGAGGAAARRTAATNQTTPSARPGTPRGAASHATPSSAAATAHGGGACCCHTAAGERASHSSGTISAANTACAACHSRSSGSTIPASASGTTTKRDHRNRQRVGERRDQRHLLEQRQRHRHEADGDERLRARGRAQRASDPRAARGAGGGDGRRPTWAYSSSPTLPNDSQKPGVKSGPRIPGERRWPAPTARRCARCRAAPATARAPRRASISSVRCAGTCEPASST